MADTNAMDIESTNVALVIDNEEPVLVSLRCYQTVRDLRVYLLVVLFVCDST